MMAANREDKTMRIEDPRDKEIINMADWEKLYDPTHRRRDWKEDRSAHSIAKFFIDRNGVAEIQLRVSDALSMPVKFERAVPEYEVKFDDFGKGRMHDVAIWGTTENGQSIFVGVEAKVDESFGKLVCEEYSNAQAKQRDGESTNAPKRIERLVASYFRNPNPVVCDVRYQLLYATAGTLAADADLSVLFVVVFKTSLYDESKGEKNDRDYAYFMREVGAVPIKKTRGHMLSKDKRQVCFLYAYFNMPG